MKIAIIAGTFFPHKGGVQVEIHNLANKLVERGNKVDVFVFKKVNLANNLYNVIKLNYFYLSFLYIIKYFLNFNLKPILHLFKFIDLNYEVYHFSFINFKSLILIEYLKIFKKKILVTFHGADIQVNKKINYGFRINVKFNIYLLKIIKKIDGFQCISQLIYKDLIKLDINKRKITKIPNSIYLKKFISKNKIHNSNKCLRLITVGRYAKYKKGYDLIPALGKKLFSSKINFKWKIIGQNSDFIYQNEFISKNKKHFIALPNINNNNEKYYPPKKLIRQYLNSHLYVNLARIESFGLTFVEALASKTAIISLGSTGINKILMNKKIGFFVKNINQIVKILKKIQANEKILYKIQKNTRQSVRAFDLDKNIKKIISFYTKFINY
jgi:glycosyltransferase involved in cell wall biosynthesis